MCLLPSVNANNASSIPMNGPWVTMKLKVVEASLWLTSWRALGLSIPERCWRCMAQTWLCPISRRMDSLLRCCLRRNLDWDSGMYYLFYFFSLEILWCEILDIIWVEDFNEFINNNFFFLYKPFKHIGMLFLVLASKLCI